jgi:hypothetical protein
MTKRTKNQNLLNKEETEQVLEYLNQRGNQLVFAKDMGVTATMVNLWKQSKRFPAYIRPWLNLKNLKSELKVTLEE